MQPICRTYTTTVELGMMTDDRSGPVDPEVLAILYGERSASGQQPGRLGPDADLANQAEDYALRERALGDQVLRRQRDVVRLLERLQDSTLDDRIRSELLFDLQWLWSDLQEQQGV